MDQERKIVLHCSKTCIRMMFAALDIILSLEAVVAKNTHDRTEFVCVNLQFVEDVDEEKTKTCQLFQICDDKKSIGANIISLSKDAGKSSIRW